MDTGLASSFPDPATGTPSPKQSTDRGGAEPVGHPSRLHQGGAAALTLGALGVVFGDIGTSPLYAVQTVFTADGHAVKTAPARCTGSSR